MYPNFRRALTKSSFPLDTAYWRRVPLPRTKVLFTCIQKNSSKCWRSKVTIKKFIWPCRQTQSWVDCWTRPESCFLPLLCPWYARAGQVWFGQGSRWTLPKCWTLPCFLDLELSPLVSRLFQGSEQLDQPYRIDIGLIIFNKIIKDE